VGIAFAVVQVFGSLTPWRATQARTAAIAIAVILVVVAVTGAMIVRRTERVRKAGAIGSGLAELAFWGIPAAVLAMVLLLLA
jgi:hypothetical protein